MKPSKDQQIWLSFRAKNRSDYAEPDPDSLKRGEIRRRIEDVQEGLRLDREAFGEVWDKL